MEDNIKKYLLNKYHNTFESWERFWVWALLPILAIALFANMMLPGTVAAGIPTGLAMVGVFSIWNGWSAV